MNGGAFEHNLRLDPIGLLNLATKYGKFLSRGTKRSVKGGGQPIIWPKIPKKLHRNEECKAKRRWHYEKSSMQIRIVSYLLIVSTLTTREHSSRIRTACLLTGIFHALPHVMHVPPPSTTYVFRQTCPPTLHAPPPATHGPLLWTTIDRRLWKYYLAPNFVCGR